MRRMIGWLAVLRRIAPASCCAHRPRAVHTKRRRCRVYAVCARGSWLASAPWKRRGSSRGVIHTHDVYGVAALCTLPSAGKIVFLRPFKGRKKAQTVWDAVWIDAASECFPCVRQQRQRRLRRRLRRRRHPGHPRPLSSSPPHCQTAPPHAISISPSCVQP